MSTNIKSQLVNIDNSSEFVFNYLNDFNNIINLLPQDKISDWESTFDSCSFKIQNAAIIPLVKSSTEPNHLINIVSGDNAPFPFTLDVHIKTLDDNKCEGYLNFEGEINMFLKMMVVKPLTALFDYMASELKKVSEAEVS